MRSAEIVTGIKKDLADFCALETAQKYPDELYLKVRPADFRPACLALHKLLPSPVMMLFAGDERAQRGVFEINAVFVDFRGRQWITVAMDIPRENPGFDSLAREIHSASLFEREIREMFGIEPRGNPDLRRLRLHDEVCPAGNFPLRKDFQKIQPGEPGVYKFNRVEGEGIFEVPVGPVHAGIIGPGHFRFSVAGEPIINLEARLGFTHRGVEKLFEGRSCLEAVRIAERVSGDASFAHSLAFSQAVEKIAGAMIPVQAVYLRAVFLELERLYNHVNDLGGMSVDAGFSFPSAYASIIKEAILQLNERLTGSRYLRKINQPGGVALDLNEAKKQILLDSLRAVKKDFQELVKMLYSSVSFMDRVDTTGVLRKKTALDLGVVGLVARASGIPTDLRKYFPGPCKEAKFKMASQESGDVLARLRLRIAEFEESLRLIEEFSARLARGEKIRITPQLREGSALGYAEGWRGPVLYWLRIDRAGLITRCKVVDASFLNWQALGYAALGNIIPDFPLCNKSFDLSYPGNDL